MRTNKNLLSNMVYSGVFQLLYLIIPVLTIPYVARIFSVDQLGLYAISFSVVTFLLKISSFGMPLYGMREIAQTNNIKKRTEVFLKLWLIQIMASTFIFLLYTIIIFIFIGDKRFFFIQGLLIVVNIFDISWFFNGIEEIKRTLFRNISSKLVTIILIFIFINNKEDLHLYALINVLGMFFANIMMFYQAKLFLEYRNQKKLPSKQDIRGAFTLLIPQAIETGRFTAPRLITGWVSTYIEVGFLDQGMKVTGILSTICSSIVSVMVPRISYLTSENKNKEIEKITTLFVQYSMFLVTVIIGGTLAVSSYFVPLFFGEGYNNVIPIMNISIFSLLFSIYNYFLGRGVLVANNLDSKYQRVTKISLVFLILISLVFTNYFGALGAAVSFVIGEAFMMSFLLYYSKKYIDVPLIRKNILFAVVSIVVNFYALELSKKRFFFESDLISFTFFGAISVLITLLFFIVIRQLSSMR